MLGEYNYVSNMYIKNYFISQLARCSKKWHLLNVCKMCKAISCVVYLTQAAYLSGNIRQQHIPVITEPLFTCCEI